MHSNKIETIHAKAFENCSNLKELRLFNNKLTRIDENNTFRNQTQLNKFLINNRIEKIDVKAFENCFNLTKLYICMEIN